MTKMQALEWLIWRLPIPLSAIEWCWGLLPDECQVKECRRTGIRGNEVVCPDGVTRCNYCHALYLWKERQMAHEAAWLERQEKQS